MVRKDGTPGPEAPEMRYRWVRTLGEDGWKTTMTVLSVSPDAVQTPKGPQAVSRKVPVSRIEIGDPDRRRAIFDAEGRMLFMLPTRAAGRRMRAPASGAALPAELEAVRGAAAAFKAQPGVGGRARGPTPATRRRSALARLGRSAPAHAPRDGGPGAPRSPGTWDRRRAWCAGSSASSTTATAHTTEVLSDPTWAVPVEINVARDGVLVSHSVLSYDEDPGAGLVRRRIRSEQLLSPESGDRALVDFELSNIRLDRGGAR